MIFWEQFKIQNGATENNSAIISYPMADNVVTFNRPVSVPTFTADEATIKMLSITGSLNLGSDSDFLARDLTLTRNLSVGGNATLSNASIGTATITNATIYNFASPIDLPSGSTVGGKEIVGTYKISDNSGVQAILSQTTRTIVAIYRLGGFTAVAPSNEEADKLIAFGTARGFVNNDYIGFMVGGVFRWYTVQDLSANAQRGELFTTSKAGIVWFQKA